MIKICIDSGHGGKDSGAVNSKQLEKDYTLAIAKKVATKLKASGYSVIMTRESDKYLSLSQRANIANKSGCTAFISIHLNSATNKNANGIETYKYTGATHNLAENIQSALIKRLPQEKDRGVKQASFHVLKYTAMPAALVEVGFLSHQPTADKFNSYWYQDQLATAIYEGITKYKK